MERRGLDRAGLRRVRRRDRAALRERGQRLRLLLDTHVLLWALADDSALTRERRAQIEDPANDVFVSAASAWEIEIKRAAGRLRAPEDLLGAIAATGLSPLDVTLEHGVAAGRLPLHHRDPFDRLLIGQAQLEGMALVTHDAALAAYPVAILPA